MLSTIQTQLCNTIDVNGQKFDENKTSSKFPQSDFQIVFCINLSLVNGIKKCLAFAASEPKGNGKFDFLVDFRQIEAITYNVFIGFSQTKKTSTIKSIFCQSIEL